MALKFTVLIFVLPAVAGYFGPTLLFKAKLDFRKHFFLHTKSVRFIRDESVNFVFLKAWVPQKCFYFLLFIDMFVANHHVESSKPYRMD